MPEPWFNEPGFERTRGTPAGTRSSDLYNMDIMCSTVKWAMTRQLQGRAESVFKRLILRHFMNKRRQVIETVDGWLALANRLVDTSGDNSKSKLRQLLAKLLSKTPRHERLKQCQRYFGRKKE